MTHTVAPTLAYQSIPHSIPPLRIAAALMTAILSVWSGFLILFIIASVMRVPWFGGAVRFLQAGGVDPFGSFGGLILLLPLIALFCLTLVFASLGGRMNAGIARGDASAHIAAITLSCLLAGGLVVLLIIVAYTRPIDWLWMIFATFGVVLHTTFCAVHVLLCRRSLKIGTTLNTPIRNAWVRYCSSTAHAGLFTAAIIVLLSVTVPQFREVFKDFRTSLPLLTEWLLMMSGFIANSLFRFVFLLLPFAVGLLAPLPMLLLRLQRQKPTPERTRLYPLFLLLLLTVSPIGIALLLPLYKLIKSVHGGHP